MYDIIFSKQSFQKLRKLPKNIQRIIRLKITDLARNPYNPNNNVTKLHSMNGYRLRIGDWRVIYEIHDHQLIVEVINIGSRGDIYS